MKGANNSPEHNIHSELPPPQKKVGTFVLAFQCRCRNVPSEVRVVLRGSVFPFRAGSWCLLAELSPQRLVLRLQLPDFILHLLDDAREAAAALHDALALSRSQINLSLFPPLLSLHRTAASISPVPYCGPARFVHSNLGRDLVPERLCRLSPLVQLRGFGWSAFWDSGPCFIHGLYKVSGHFFCLSVCFWGTSRGCEIVAWSTWGLTGGCVEFHFAALLHIRRGRRMKFSSGADKTWR